MIELKEGSELIAMKQLDFNVATLQIMMLQRVMSRTGDCCYTEEVVFVIVSQTRKR